MKIPIRNLIAIILTLFSINAVCDVEYFYLEGAQKPGSKFKIIEAKSRIPFDKRYSELTELQKTIFRENYSDMPKLDTPPFPQKGLQSIYLPIIKGHRRKPVESEIFAIAVVDKQGKVVNVDVYKAPHKKMAELVSTVIFATKFDPAVCNGEPCAMEFPLEMTLHTEPSSFRQ